MRDIQDNRCTNLRGRDDESLTSERRYAGRLRWIGSLALALVIVAIGVSPVWAQCTNCTISNVGSDTVLTFTANGTFTPPATTTSVRYLVVGGGAGGGGVPAAGNIGGAGGGGAGGLLAGTGFAVTPLTVYNVTVGAGGAPGVGGTSQGGNGGNSVFSTLTAIGGGGGASAAVNNTGEDGGSGGGGRIGGSPGGNGVAGQGNDGGAGNNAAGGGGGSGGAGADGGGAAGGAGGGGTANNITGANPTYAAGGVGGNYGTRAAGANAAANTGNGGGGASGANGGGAFNGGSGGSGVVVIRFTPPLTYYSRVAPTGNWSAGASWSTAGCGGANANQVPIAGSHVVICSADTIRLDANSANLASLTIQNTGILNIGNNNTARTLNVSGDLSNDGTLRYNNNNGNHSIIVGGQFTNSGSFTNVNNTNGGRRSLTVAGLIDNSGTFRFAGRANAGQIMTVNANGGIANSGTFDVDTGSNNTHVLNIAGNLVNSGSFDMATDGNSLVAVTFNGAAAQTISGVSASSNFHNLTLNNANGLELSGTQSITVNTTLTLTSGRFTTNANVVHITSANAVGNAGAATFIVGNLRRSYTTGTQTRVFEVGTEAGGVRYAPVSVQLATITGAGNFTVSSTAGDQPNIGSSTLDAALSVNRHWTLGNDSVTYGGTGTVVFNYVGADVDGGADFNEFYVGRYNAPNWTEITPSARAATSTTIDGIGAAAISGVYQIAERSQALSLVSAVAICGAGNQVEVLFSQAVTAATAQNPANYALSSGATVSTATLNADARIVTLTTSALVAQSYTLTVNNIQAAPAGPIIAANSTASFFAEGGYLSGLRGSYYANMTLAGIPAGQRVDGPVNFDWANGTPGVAGIGADNFSVRWEGFVTPSTTGNYTFRTRSDDGVRLYVNGVLVINNWTDHAAIDNDSAPIALTTGQRYPVVMEYYENGGQAVAQLSWNGPGTGGFQFIPRSALSHFCGLPAPLAFYKMDETSWNGTAGEVEDSSGNGLSGTAAGGALPAPAQVCNGAQLNGSSRYVQVGGLSGLLNATASLAFWIRTTQAGNNTGWQAPGVTGVELSGGADDIFWGWLDASGRIGVSVANDFTTKSTVAVNDGIWRHVVLTRDHIAGTFQIYIDGALNASGSIATGVIGTPFSSIGRIEDTGGTPEYLNGQLDEVRIYATVLTASEVLTVRDVTRPCLSTVDHYYVQHASSGINCQAESVSITAHDVVHAPTSADSRIITISADRVAGAVGTRGDWSLLAGTGSLNNGTADDGVATYTFGAGESNVLLAYKNTWIQTVNVSVSDGVASDTSGNANADAGYNQNLSFEPSGFRLVDGNNNLPAQTAGVSGGPFYLQAVQTGTGGCTTPGPCAGVCTVPTGFENGATVALDLAFRCDNPTTCQAGQQVSIINNGTTAVAGNPAAGVSSYTSKTLLFGADGRAAFNFVYPDVGAISLHVRYDIPLGTGAASGNLMTGSSNSFVVRPYGFVLSNIETTAGAVANPGASDHTGGVFIRAGDDFSATVTSVNFAGNATPNFGREIAPETVRLTSALVAPAAGAAPALANPIAFGSFSNGAATGTTFAWGEVGIITLTPEVGDADYLGAGNVTGAASGNVGRFIPYDFAATRNAPFFEAGCTVAGKDAFTYAGQGFVYQTAPILTVTARNRVGGTTQNYRDDFWKITAATLTGKAYTALSGSIDTTGISGADPVIGVNGDGTGTLTFAAGTGLRFVRATPVVPFNAEIALAINVIDGDGTVVGAVDGGAAGNPVRFGVATAGNGIPFTGTTVSVGKTTREIRFGRLRIENAAGTTRLDLPLRVQAQYYDTNGFRLNTDDSCTGFPTNSIAMDFAGGSNLVACETAIAPVGNVTLASGEAPGLRLRAPGTGNDGRVDLRLNLAAASGNVCTAVGGVPAAAVTAARDYLRGNWTGAAYDQDPSARATFGIYKNANEFIYFQENF